MNELYDVLKTSKTSDFLIREEQTESREAFFIGQKLDMSRAKKVTHTFLTVFVDSEDGKFRGSAEKEIHQGISREEMKQEIDQALFAAQFVQNPWYPIAEPSDAPANDGMPDASRDLTSELVKLVQAMQEIKSEEDSRVNSYEIFVNQKQTRIRNSRGVDVTFSGFDCEIEVVTNSRKDDHEIEIYKDLRFSDKSAEKIIAEVRGMFHTGRQRLNAVPTRQNEHADVLLSGDAVGRFFQYFAMHTNASYQYMGVAKTKIGEAITGADADPLNIRLVPTLDGSAKNAPYDETGMPVAERVLFENGICRSYWGSLQHAHYIGMKDTTSMNNMVVEGGSKTLDELRSMPHIEITDFSAFDMDAVSGTCGGEIRLAYESGGTTSHPTTSGSLSARYDDVLKNLTFSKETQQLNNRVVPCAVLLRDVTVAGE